MANTPPTPQVPDLARDSGKAHSQTHFGIKLMETEVSYLRFNDPMLKFSGPLKPQVPQHLQELCFKSQAKWFVVSWD